MRTVLNLVWYHSIDQIYIYRKRGGGTKHTILQIPNEISRVNRWPKKIKEKTNIMDLGVKFQKGSGKKEHLKSSI